MILSDRVSGKMSSWGIFAAIAFALIALPGWSLGLPKKPQPVSDSSKPSVADDPLLRELIEQGKFEEAKARMATLKTKQAADKAIADGIFPDKWKEALLKTLPAACVKDHPRDAPLAWTFCMSCHTGLKEPGAVDRKRTYFDVEFTWPPPLPTSDGKSESPWKVDRFRPNELVEDKPLITFEGNKRFYVLSFDTQGAYLVALQSDSQKQVWQSRVIDSPPNRRPEVKWSLVDSNDGKTVTLTSARNEDLINYQLDWSTGKMIQTSKARQQPISGKANEPASPPLSKIEAQSPDGKLLAVTSEAHILLIDRDTGQVIRSIGVDGAANIAGVTFSTDGKLLKRVDKDGATWTIDVATGKILERTAARRPAVIEVEYSQAVANVESARARLARLKGLTDVNKETIDEAAQYLERADRQLQSLVAAVKDAHKLADTSRALAEMEFTRIKELVAKGAATDVQLEAARVKLASAEIQVRRLESILKQGVAITEPMTPPSVTALTTSTRSSSWLKSDSGSVDAQSLNVLDLAERYLRATADVKKAKNRIESMKGSKLAVSQQEANEAKIELEAAEKRVQLLSGFIKDAVNTARAEIATAEEELARVSQLSRKGFVAQTEVDRAKSRVDAARARVKQLETILSTVGMTKPDSTPPM